MKRRTSQRLAPVREAYRIKPPTIDDEEVRLCDAVVEALIQATLPGLVRDSRVTT